MQPPLATVTEPFAPLETAPDEQLAPDPVSSAQLRCLPAARRAAIDRFEIAYIRALLHLTEGNVTRAAAIAGVSRQVIHKLIAKHRDDLGLGREPSTCG